MIERNTRTKTAGQDGKTDEELCKSEDNNGVAFKRARTKEQINSRKKEIIDACAVLYREGGYGNVNLKAISEMTSISRQAIYGYFKTKEEILLDLLLENELNWEQDMIAFTSSYTDLTKEEYASMLTGLFSNYGTMLELIGMFFSVIDANCSIEKLTEFRENAVDFYHQILFNVSKFFPDASRKSQRNFASILLAYVVGLYPMNHMSEKQLEAERRASVSIEYPENYDRKTAFETQCYEGILLLLDGMLEER